ncbi:PAS domain S-box protein [Streptomyces chartreusis]
MAQVAVAGFEDGFGGVQGARAVAESPTPGRGPVPPSRQGAIVRRFRTSLRRASRAYATWVILTHYLAAVVCILGVLFGVASGRAVSPVMVSLTSAVVFTLVVHQTLMLFRNGRLTRELVEKEGHFRSLVQGSSDVIMIVAPAGIIRYVSPAAAGAWGYGTDELVGSELAAAIHPEDLGMVVHEIRRFPAADPAAVADSRLEFRVKSGAGAWLNTEASQPPSGRSDLRGRRCGKAGLPASPIRREVFRSRAGGCAWRCPASDEAVPLAARPRVALPAS